VRYGKTGIGSNMFNMFPGGPSEGAVAATFAYKNKGWRNVYILEDPTLSYTKSFIKYFKYSWGKFGGKVVGDDTFMNSDPSIATQITRLKNVNPKPDFIFLGSYAPGGASATKQIRAAGIDLPLISGAGFDGTFWVGAVPDISNFFAVVGGVTTAGADPNKFRAALYAKYRATYKKDPPLGEQTMNGYSAIYAYKIAVERAKSFDTDKVRAQLEKFKGVQLANRKVTWTPKCHIVLGAAMPVVEFVDGKEKFVAEPKPQFVQPTIC
jgi:branched-chain amino acid transport system substrate-binding protein